jgi:hypothetical protein
MPGWPRWRKKRTPSGRLHYSRAAPFGRTLDKASDSVLFVASITIRKKSDQYTGVMIEGELLAYLPALHLNR